MITIKDIARLANVSPATVSKALNNKPDVAEATRKRILEVARAHHFTPNVFGQTLKSRKTQNIGLIFCREPYPLSSNPFYSRVLEGIEAELKLHQYNLILHFITETTYEQMPKIILQKQVDGVIMVGSFQRAFIEMIHDCEMPLVLVDPKSRMDDYHQILIDNEHGAVTAVSYLIKSGHRRIAFISGDLERLSFNQRFTGYKKALEQYQIPFDPALIRTGGIENGYEHVNALLNLKARPTAIFSANDINAIYGYRAIRDHKLNIPEDVSIIGFDDIELAHHSSPALTTIRVYKEELGSIAVRHLLKVIAQEWVNPMTMLVPTKLIERESVCDLHFNN